MAEEDLKRAIQERIQRERETILSQARQEAEGILSEAKKEAASQEESYLLEIKKTCLLKETKELNQINLEVKKELLEAKEKKILEVLTFAKEQLKGISQDKMRYKPIFKGLLLEALSYFGQNVKLQLKVNPLDKAPALEVIKEQKVNAQLETQESIDGGLKLCDLEENIIILNTFESRLNKLMPELRQEVSLILFD